MASRQILKSTIDWVAFAERVPKNQREYFRAFKTKSDSYINKALTGPEKLPEINWAFYQDNVAVPGLVEKLKKQYASLTISYPEDRSNTVAAVEKENKLIQEEAAVENKKFMKSLEDMKDMQNVVDQLPKTYEWTRQLDFEYFPETALNPEKPAHWPFTPRFQVDHPGAIR